MEHADRGAGGWKTRSDGTLYEHEWRGPAGRAQLERRRLHAQRDRARRTQDGVKGPELWRTSEVFMNSCTAMSTFKPDELPVGKRCSRSRQCPLRSPSPRSPY